MAEENNINRGEEEYAKLLQLTGVFLIPQSVLATALASAESEILKASISILAASIAVVWLMAAISRIHRVSLEFLTYAVGYFLPGLATLAWTIAATIHGPAFWKQFG